MMNRPLACTQCVSPQNKGMHTCGKQNIRCARGGTQLASAGAEEKDALLHHLWTAAVGMPGYNYGYEHTGCSVVITDPRQAIQSMHHLPVPRICTCECRPCKRAWEAQGRPRVVNGVVERGGLTYPHRPDLDEK